MSRSCQRATFSSATTAFPRTLFFQAEDGIRDHCVTGVQTCALPISEERQWLNCVITSGWCPWRIDSESARVLANDSQSLSRVPTRVPTVLVPVWSEGVMTSQKDTTRHERTGGPVAGELLFCFDVTLRCTLIPYQFA